MRALLLYEADAPGRVAERDQVLAQQADPRRRPVRFGDLRTQARRDPVPAQQITHRRPGADPGQDLVVLPRQHGMPPSIRCMFSCEAFPAARESQPRQTPTWHAERWAGATIAASTG